RTSISGTERDTSPCGGDVRPETGKFMMAGLQRPEKNRRNRRPLPAMRQDGLVFAGACSMRRCGDEKDPASTSIFANRQIQLVFTCLTARTRLIGVRRDRVLWSAKHA